jgi:hypothetical protein
LKKDVVWSAEANTAFEILRKCLSAQPVLMAPDLTKSFLVQTDASYRAVSCVLLQEDAEGVLHPVAYQSRKLASAETRYPVIELEALAIIYACNVFKPYLIGNRFTLLTDHKPLIFLRQTPIKNSRIYRWSLSLEDLDFEVSFVAGKLNCIADYLSRPPVVVARPEVVSV